MCVCCIHIFAVLANAFIFKKLIDNSQTFINYNIQNFIKKGKLKKRKKNFFKIIFYATLSVLYLKYRIHIYKVALKENHFFIVFFFFVCFCFNQIFYDRKIKNFKTIFIEEFLENFNSKVLIHSIRFLFIVILNQHYQ